MNLPLPIFFLLPIIFFVAVFIAEVKGRSSLGDSLLESFTALVIGLFIGGFLGVGLMFIAPQHEEGYDSRLVSAHSAQGIQGSFFLASGTIKDTFKYVFWYDAGNGGYKRFEIDPRYSEVTVYEDATAETARVHTSYKKVNSEWSNWVIMPPGAVPSEYTFHVPPGSVVTGFVFN